MLVDAVVCHWLEEMVESAGNQGGCRNEGIHQNVLLYADDGMIASSDPGWLQEEFFTLLGLFDWVDLSTNAGNTVRMIFRPCQAAGTQSEAVYEQRMTGAGLSYRERHRVQLVLPLRSEERGLIFH